MMVLGRQSDASYERVFGGLIAVSFLVGGYWAWERRGPSLEEMRDAAAKKDVWAWTIPDNEPAPTPVTIPTVEFGPDGGSDQWMHPGALIPTTTDQTPDFSWVLATAGPTTGYIEIPLGIGCGVHRIPIATTTTAWPQPALFTATNVYRANWLLTDSFAGRAAYNPPKEMVQGEWKRITVRIAAKGDEYDLLGRMVKAATWDTKISRVMSVKLSGETFVVKPFTAETQAMGDGPTEWLFDVQGQESGKHDLVLAIARIVPVGEMGKQPRTFPPETRSITVTINPAWSTKQFLNAYWQWVATSIAIPLLLWGIAVVRQREKKRKSAGFVSPVAPRP
jgi:hypothetical protein